MQCQFVFVYLGLWVNSSTLITMAIGSAWVSFEIMPPDMTFDFLVTGHVALHPPVMSMMGGDEVMVGGPCFDPDNDQIMCMFDKVKTPGYVVSAVFAKCIGPLQTFVGHLPFSLSRDNGQTFPYTSRVQVGKISPQVSRSIILSKRTKKRKSTARLYRN